MIVVPYARIDTELAADLTALGSLYMFLFIVNVTPDGNTDITDLDVTVPSWADVQAMGSYTGPTADGTARKVTWADRTFTNSTGSPVNVYGYAVTDSGKTVLHWSERNSSAPVSVAAGATYTVKPYYSRKSQP